jgi:ParB/RepB/Spo0J family partition protein
MTTAIAAREFLTIPIALIDEPSLPSRSDMDDAKLDELVESIRLIGLQQPMVLARVGERYEVIAGHRRRIACARAGLVDAPCFVYPSRDSYSRTIQAHENTKREELSPADEALWFADLLETECGGDVDKLCGLVGEKLSYVDGRLALVRGDPEIFQALRAGSINIGVAHELNKFPAGRYRRHYLECAMRGGATRALVMAWLTEFKQLGLDEHAVAVAAPASAPSMPDAASNPFTCEICGRADNVHLIRQINIHQHCKLAILDPMLANARGDS